MSPGTLSFARVPRRALSWTRKKKTDRCAYPRSRGCLFRRCVSVASANALHPRMHRFCAFAARVLGANPRNAAPKDSPPPPPVPTITFDGESGFNGTHARARALSHARVCAVPPPLERMRKRGQPAGGIRTHCRWPARSRARAAAARRLHQSACARTGARARGRATARAPPRLPADTMPLQSDIDLLNPPAELEKSKHKLKRLVQSPNSFFMDVKCQGCFNMCVAARGAAREPAAVLFFFLAPSAARGRAALTRPRRATPAVPRCSRTRRPWCSAAAATRCCASRPAAARALLRAARSAGRAINFSGGAQH